ncbi:MAG: ATP-binding protein [Glaciecola sp.]|jgi:signal transduction histidine kinase|nr:ATP-binding protein [Glaciecola sp.]MDG1468827.1 ATP-binding protein [Glaciecola sp.]MDG1921596.1 ATP-binding protein [Glaciecola sp.]
MPKLTLSLLLVVLLAVVSLGAALDNFFNQYQTQPNQMAHELSAYHQLGTSLAATLDMQQQPQQFITSWQQNNDLSVELVDLDDLFLPDSLKADFYAGKPLDFESEKSISMHFIIPSHKKALSFTVPPIAKATHNNTLALLLTVLFYLGILMVVLVWLSPLIKQLKQLEQTTKAFGEGQLQQRIHVKSASYIASIENEFNRMAQRIESLISDNKLLSDAVAHDLRTPLARLRFGIEMLQETSTPETREKHQQRLSRDIDEMERLVNVLLNYARIEQSMLMTEKQNIDLNALVSECVEAASHDNKIIHWQPQNDLTTTDVMINGDANYLSMLINNLLGNAVQYANHEISVRIEKSEKSEKKGAVIRLSISDDGPGIPHEKRDELSKPFMRGDNAHGKPGYGMGLAIVLKIAQLHDARFAITDSAELGGTECSVSFQECRK